MASIDSEVSTNLPVIMISSISVSKQSDSETEEVLLLLVLPEKSLRQLSGSPPSHRAQLLHVCSHSLINIITICELLREEHGLTAKVPKW